MFLDGLEIYCKHIWGTVVGQSIHAFPWGQKHNMCFLASEAKGKGGAKGKVKGQGGVPSGAAEQQVEGQQTSSQCCGCNVHSQIGVGRFWRDS